MPLPCRFSALTTFLAVLGGCATRDTTTALRLIATFSDPAIDQLAVAMDLRADVDATLAADGGGDAAATGVSRRVVAPSAAQLLRSPYRVLLLLDPNWSDRDIALSVEGLALGRPRLRDDKVVRVARGVTTDVEISLGPLCRDDCPAGDRQCSGNGVRTCQRDALGCFAWSLPAACPAAAPFCSLGRCEATCKDECTAGERRCVAGDASRFISCGQFDDDSCLDRSAPTSCGAKESCRERDGQCVLLCDGKACACTVGATQPCADVGRCRGGVRTCDGQGFGPCTWQLGPVAELCNGVDDDCDTQTDEAAELVSAPCVQQRGVCAGAVKRCGGLGGWLACGATEYERSAQAQGHSASAYQAVETLCDGLDNDCNGQVDEHPSCCKPNCASKACGADDGCGNKCQGGSCGPNASCKNGSCSCDFLSCGPSCCASGDTVCAATGACCAPSCAGKACGADDGCGNKCQSGSCGPNASCKGGSCSCDGAACGSACCGPADSCVSGSCQIGCTTQPLVADATASRGAYLSFKLDGAGRAHISHYDESDSSLYYTTNAGGRWVSTRVDAKKGVGQTTALALDGAGNVHISYFDGAAGDLRHATNRSGSWVARVLDDGAGRKVGRYSAIAYHAAQGTMFISYYEDDRGDLWLGQLALANSGYSAMALVTAGDVGLTSSLAVDGSGTLHLSYYDFSGFDLRYYERVVPTAHDRLVDDAGDVGTWSAIAVPPGSGKAQIVYYDRTNRNLKFARDTGFLGVWEQHTVDSVNAVGQYPALVIDASGARHVSYIDETQKQLGYATDPGSIKGDSWTVSRIAPAVLSETGIARDAARRTHFAFRDAGGLKYFVRCP